jgi:hypothetical protein
LQYELKAGDLTIPKKYWYCIDKRETTEPLISKVEATTKPIFTYTDNKIEKTLGSHTITKKVLCTGSPDTKSIEQTRIKDGSRWYYRDYKF